MSTNKAFGKNSACSKNNAIKMATILMKLIRKKAKSEVLYHVIEL